MIVTNTAPQAGECVTMYEGNGVSIRDVYNMMDLHDLEQLDKYIMAIVERTADLKQSVERYQLRMAHPRCNGKMSGKHAIHAAQTSCPLHGVGNGYRIRAYVRKDNESVIFQAMANYELCKELESLILQRAKELNALRRAVGLKDWYPDGFSW